MAEIIIDPNKTGKDLDIGRFGLGQGGVSDRPMIDGQVEAIRSLNVKYIRLFVQEYFNVYPEKNVYYWKTLDKAVKTILDTGAKPVMCITIKPKILFPVIDETKNHPAN